MKAYELAAPAASRLARPAPSPVVGSRVRRATGSLRVALVGEGAYPFNPGGVSLFCHQLIHGMPEYSFTAVALTVDGTERSSWPRPANLTEVVNIPLWGPRLRRRHGRRIPLASFDEHYEILLRSIFRPLVREYEVVSAEEFVMALHGLYEYAQESDLNDALLRDEPLERLRRIWHDAGLDSGRPGAVGPLTLHDAVLATNRIEHLLRPLSHPPVKADVCHLTMNGTSVLVGLASKWAYGTPVMMSEHGIYLRERYLALTREDVSQAVKAIVMRFNRRLAAAAYRCVDILAPHSRYNGRWQLYGGADPTRIRIMYNGIDPRDFPMVRHEPEYPTIVYVGRIDPLKDLHTLIRAFAIVRERLPTARLRMFGPVPTGNEKYHVSCAQLIAELGLSDAASFEGRIASQVDAYRAGHLVALTSVSEGFPYTVVESMSMGRPVVCTNVGGVSEAVGNAGFVVPPTDHTAVAFACIRLLEDARLRRTLGMLARQRVLERFTLDQWSNAYRKIYVELALAAHSDIRAIPGVRPRPAAHGAVRPYGHAMLPAVYSDVPRNTAGPPRGLDPGTFIARRRGESWYLGESLTAPVLHHADAAFGNSANDTRQPMRLSRNR
jgi:polysaccharide biosynthesis protein PelF